MRPHPLLDYLGGPLLTALFGLPLWVETRRPLRRRVQDRLQRLVTNGAIAATAALAVRLASIPVVVTPRMHGIHHSIVERETNSNWSTIFSWWDRLDRTVRLDIPQDAIGIGVPAYRDPHELTFFRLLAMPFVRQRTEWHLPDGTRPERREVNQ